MFSCHSRKNFYQTILLTRYFLRRKNNIFFAPSVNERKVQILQAGKIVETVDLNFSKFWLKTTFRNTQKMFYWILIHLGLISSIIFPVCKARFAFQVKQDQDWKICKNSKVVGNEVEYKILNFHHNIVAELPEEDDYCWQYLKFFIKDTIKMLQRRGVGRNWWEVEEEGWV